MTEAIDGSAALKKKLIHDLTPCGRAEEFMRSMGMVPGSDEVETMEHRASHLRLNQLAPINYVLMATAMLAGEVVGRCILENQGIEPDEETVKSYVTVACASSQAVIANLLEMNLLHLGGHL